MRQKLLPRPVKPRPKLLQSRGKPGKGLPKKPVRPRPKSEPNLGAVTSSRFVQRGMPEHVPQGSVPTSLNQIRNYIAPATSSCIVEGGTAHAAWLQGVNS